jgi:hypothetical protein
MDERTVSRRTTLRAMADQNVRKKVTGHAAVCQPILIKIR